MWGSNLSCLTQLLQCWALSAMTHHNVCTQCGSFSDTFRDTGGRDSLGESKGHHSNI